MQPAWFQVGSNARLGTETWYEPPANRANLQETTDGSILQEGLSDLQFGRQRPSVWPISTTNIPAGDAINLVDEYDDPLLTLAWTMYNTSDSVVESGTDGLTMIETAVPFDGVWRDTFRWDGPATAFETDAFLIMRARWNATAGGIELSFGPAKFETSCGLPVGCRTYVVEFTLDDLSVGYAETGGVTVTFGTLEDDEASIPAVDGGNAVEDSQTTYGVLEERIDVEGYLLDPEQALLMAQGYVLANLTPRAVRSLDLGWRGSTVALFDDRGRLFGTPDSGEGLLVGVEYTDDFISVTGGKRVRVEETIPGTAGFIPTDITWLVNNDSSLWQNDDGSNSEPA
jgi:hypothetical protein